MLFLGLRFQDLLLDVVMFYGNSENSYSKMNCHPLSAHGLLFKYTGSVSF